MADNTGWFLPASALNELQIASVNRQIERCKRAHHTDLAVRINGENESHEADWIKHMRPVATPPAGAGEAVRDDGRIASLQTALRIEQHRTEAVRELPGKWRAEADWFAAGANTSASAAHATSRNKCADELDRALTGGDKQGDSSPTGGA
jgi:hypothetical protein